MSKQFNRQKMGINQLIHIFQSAPTSKVGPKGKQYSEESPFLRNRIRRAVNADIAASAEKKNMEKRGNPLSIISSEKQPNPAQRAKAMKAAKANKNRGR